MSGIFQNIDPPRVLYECKYFVVGGNQQVEEIVQHHAESYIVSRL
jgi:hypothetical protein